jgi:hypothetical protein
MTASPPTTNDWENHLDKIANYARSNTKNRPGLLVIRPGQLTVRSNAPAAELRCEYFKGTFIVPNQLSNNISTNKTFVTIFFFS